MIICFALQPYGEEFIKKTIKIFTDNTTTSIEYTTKKSGDTASTILQKIAVRIQKLCNRYRLQKSSTSTMKGNWNVGADRLLRKTLPLYEQSLPRYAFQDLETYQGPLRGQTLLQIDATDNHQSIPVYSTGSGSDGRQWVLFSNSGPLRGEFIATHSGT